MIHKEQWDWETQEKCLADLEKIQNEYSLLYEPVVSSDGEKIAIPVRNEDDEWTIAVNEKPWPVSFEKIWYLKFSPDGRLTALTQADDMWNLAVDGDRWEEEYDYVWNTIFSPDGSHIAVQVKNGQNYGIAINGSAWENDFLSMRETTIDNNGTVAATVQVEALKEADTFGFLDGKWTVAVNGKVWDQKFINVYRPIISPDGKNVAAEVRTGICEYSIAEDGQVWKKEYGCVWEAIYRSGNSLVAPVREKGNWSLAENGNPFWKKQYAQLWNPTLSPDGNRIAATAALVMGKWIISVDDIPWSIPFEDCVLQPHFSPDSRHVAAIVKDKNRWTVAVNGQPWSQWFDMIWDPVFSPDGKNVATKAEKDGIYFIVINGKRMKQDYKHLWEPVFSPDGDKLLLKFIENGKYYRRIVPLNEMF